MMKAMPPTGPYYHHVSITRFQQFISVEQSYLAQQKFPVDPDSCLAVFSAILAEPTAHISHAFQTVSSVEQILNVLCHDLGDILQLIIQLVQVLGGSAVLVRLLGPLDEGVEFDEGIGAAGSSEVLLRRVCGGEFLLDVGQEDKGKLSGVRAVADAEEDKSIVDEVAAGRGAVSGGLEGGVGRAYWMVYWPPSMLACGSELRFTRRRICLTLPLISTSSDSDCDGVGELARGADVRGQEGGAPVHRRRRRPKSGLR